MTLIRLLAAAVLYSIILAALAVAVCLALVVLPIVWLASLITK